MAAADEPEGETPLLFSCLERPRAWCNFCCAGSLLVVHRLLPKIFGALECWSMGFDVQLGDASCQRRGTISHVAAALSPLPALITRYYFLVVACWPECKGR